jgi:hypothetical protein
MYVDRDHKPIDEFHYPSLTQELKQRVFHGAYHDVLGILEFILKHRLCPRYLAKDVNDLMETSRLGYRVVDGVVICPITSEIDSKTLERAFADLASSPFTGARAHLRAAAAELTAGNYASSVRESIHAVESVAEVLEPSGNLTKALGRLEASAGIHGGMKKAFLALYGYSSDEKGIRHALLFADTPTVREADALFMIGSCSAFVSYLINTARAAGLIG